LSACANNGTNYTRLYKDGVWQWQYSTNPSSSLCDVPMAILARGLSTGADNYTQQQVRMTFVGSTFTDTDVSIFYDNYKIYQDSL